MGKEIERMGGGRSLSGPETEVALENVLRRMEDSGKLAKEIRPIGALRRLEESSREHGASFRLGLHFDESKAREVGLLLVALDREFRRVPALSSWAEDRRRHSDYALPRPVHPERSGLTIRRAEAGSLDLVLDLYGEVKELAQSGPVAVLSFILLSWQLGKISRRFIAGWGFRVGDKTHTLTGGRRKELAVLREAVALGREAIKNDYSEIDVVGQAPGVEVRISIRK